MSAKFMIVPKVRYVIMERIHENVPDSWAPVEEVNNIMSALAEVERRSGTKGATIGAGPGEFTCTLSYNKESSSE